MIAERVLERCECLRGYLIPADLKVTVTRNYGETAKEKSNELLKHLLLATLSVTLLIALALGWRESGVVLVADARHPGADAASSISSATP